FEVVGRQGDWYEIILPAGGPSGNRGFILARQVEPLDGALPPIGPPAPARAPSVQPVTAVRGFGNIGYGWVDAHKSCDAVLGQPGGFFFGGGGEFRFRNRLFVQGSLERFKRTGERAFVLDEEVFKLGIPDEVTVTPLTFTGGYRFPRRSMTPFVGGG